MRFTDEKLQALFASAIHETFEAGYNAGNNEWQNDKSNRAQLKFITAVEAAIRREAEKCAAENDSVWVGHHPEIVNGTWKFCPECGRALVKK